MRAHEKSDGVPAFPRKNASAKCGGKDAAPDDGVLRRGVFSPRETVLSVPERRHGTPLQDLLEDADGVGGHGGTEIEEQALLEDPLKALGGADVVPQQFAAAQ